VNFERGERTFSGVKLRLKTSSLGDFLFILYSKRAYIFVIQFSLVSSLLNLVFTELFLHHVVVGDVVDVSEVCVAFIFNFKVCRLIFCT
jgi:hypothetical protein